MTLKKNIIFTFDYEPFLGSKSGTLNNCIIEPTERLKLILNTYNAKAVFFIDTLYLKNLKLVSINEYGIIIKQIQQLFKEGHYIFPHIHPHWIDASYLKDINQFDLSKLDNYSLSSFNEDDIAFFFKESISSLNELGISYSNWGYRAGGWCIQPFDLFRKSFNENNIKFEFSVLPGYKNASDSQFFDFTKVEEYLPYHFSENIDIKNSDGNFIEFPISTIKIDSFTNLKDRIVKKYLWKTGDRGYGDGLSAKTASLKSNFISKEMISIDVLNDAKLKTYEKYLESNSYMHWISHPKMFTKHGLKTFDKFLNFASNKYKLEYDFNKMLPK